MIPHTPIAQKTTQRLAEAGLAGLAVFGADHLQYLAGSALPFLAARRDQPACLLWTAAAPVLICPQSLAHLFREQGWQGDLRAYPPSANGAQAALKLLADEIALRLPARAAIGLDLERLPAAWLTILQASLPKCTFSPADRLLNSLRAAKTPAEVEWLLDIAARSDHGMAGAMHHVSILGSKTEKFMSEDLRVHAMERELGVEGYHAVSIVASGPHARKFWPLAPRFGIGQEKTFKSGEVVRHEILTTQGGYWGASARTLVMGGPTPEQAAAYAHLLALRDVAVRAIRPGVACNAVFSTVLAAAQERGADLVSGLGAGHGLGVTPYEAPFLAAWDDTPLAEGMVLVIDLVLRMPSGELLRGRDTLAVTAAGCQLAECYVDWREPYLAALTF